MSVNRDARAVRMKIYFWFLAGTLTGLAMALIIVPLWHDFVAAFANRKTRITVAVTAGVVFAGSALLIYHALGSPHLLDATQASSTATHSRAAQMTGQPADSMESAIAGLEARVAREGGKREDWLLLAQSYEFVGRTADADRARKSAGTANESPGTTREKPRDAEAWRALAADYRRTHDYGKARDAFAQLEKLDAMTADAFADQADVLASLAGGSLRGAPARSIERALALNPLHAKALWLKASLAHEDKRYGEALSVWKQLRAALPPGSPDVRVVDANISEASELTRGSRTLPPASAEPAARSAEVSGTVSIDKRLASRIPPGATLFIYAKAVDSPGPPLAVVRQVTGAWPVTFHLDDRSAMIPTRKLSQFEKVVVEARVSRSGQASPAAGDLYVTSAVLKPGDGKKLQLVINQEVG
jgi:cytochrome c-type biogenesis protein CcmH/NrfG